MNEARLNVPFLKWRVWVGLGVVGAPCLVLMGSAACGGGEHASSAKSPETARAEALKHEDCSESGHRVDLMDTNGDGKPDITRIYDKGSGHEVCRISDLTHDGKPDMYEYFDDSGTVRRREFCYDDTGLVNAIEALRRRQKLSSSASTTPQASTTSTRGTGSIRTSRRIRRPGRPAHPGASA